MMKGKEKEKIKLIHDYEINPFTMMIAPYEDGGKLYSKIYELDNEFISPIIPFDIIKKSCEFFGSSYEGRREGTRTLTQITHKPPIVIDPTNDIYFFPTTSPARKQCIWLSNRHIVSSERHSNRKTIVKFRNTKKVKIPISLASFRNQLQRTTFLQVKLTERIEDAGRHPQKYGQQFKKVGASEDSVFYKFERIF